jgi:hypothetical protein
VENSGNYFELWRSEGRQTLIAASARSAHDVYESAMQVLLASSVRQYRVNQYLSD